MIGINQARLVIAGNPGDVIARIGEVNARGLESHVPAAADSVGAGLAADAEARNLARQYAGEFAAPAGRAAVA